jgi:hypothetical protein
MSKEQFTVLEDDIIEYFDDLKEKLNLHVDLKYVYQGDEKQKTLLKIVKIPDRYSVLMKADVLVSFNEKYFDTFDDESKMILIEQELALIEINIDNGTLKIGKPDLITSTGIVKKYGVEAVERANQVSVLFNQQQADQEKENKAKANAGKPRKYNKK